MTEERRVAEGLAAFGRALDRFGVPVATSQLEAAARSLRVVDASRRDSVYWALHCSLLTAREQQAAFDAVFESFWAGSLLMPPTSGPEPAADRLEPAEAAGEGAAEPAPASQIEVYGQAREEDGVGALEDGDEDDEQPASGATFSAHERLARLDFSRYGEEEMREAERLIERLGRALPMRMARRLRAAERGTRLDHRETMRRAMRTEAHPLDLAWRRRRLRPRPIVFLIDVSGSMEAYARPLVTFARGARRASKRVEVFAFGTRLTRLTGSLDRHAHESALVAVAEAIPDWAGGTRIGESLLAYDRGWGRRGMSRGAAVVIVSDGWERGGLAELDRAMAAIRRLAHSVIWVNPLAGDPDYEPLAAGMATALAHVDLFLPGHTIRDLEALSEVLGSLPVRRMRRSGQALARGGHFVSTQV